VDDNHLVARVGDNWYSFTQKGRGIMVHWATRDVKRSRSALNTFCGWVFESFPWCRMLLAPIERKSVVKLAERCGFVKILESLEHDGAYALIKVRP
jgi:hypothetical protein